jgi:hypothetical protein
MLFAPFSLHGYELALLVLITKHAANQPSRGLGGLAELSLSRSLSLTHTLRLAHTAALFVHSLTQLLNPLYQPTEVLPQCSRVNFEIDSPQHPGCAARLAKLAQHLLRSIQMNLNAGSRLFFSFFF